MTNMFGSTCIILLTFITIFTYGENITTTIINETNTTMMINETDTTTTATTIVNETNTTTSTIRNSTSKPKRLTFQKCGLALFRLFDQMCELFKQRLRKYQSSISRSTSTHEKRHMLEDDDPFTRTILFRDSSRKL